MKSKKNEEQPLIEPTPIEPYLAPKRDVSIGCPSLMDPDRAERLIIQAKCLTQALGNLVISLDDLMEQDKPDPKPIYDKFWDAFSDEEKCFLHLADMLTVGVTFNSYGGGVDAEIWHQSVLPLMRKFVAEEDEEERQMKESAEKFRKQQDVIAVKNNEK